MEYQMIITEGPGRARIFATGKVVEYCICEEHGPHHPDCPIHCAPVPTALAEAQKDWSHGYLEAAKAKLLDAIALIDSELDEKEMAEENERIAGREYMMESDWLEGRV